MNIFALSPDPIISARAHCDQHLHKMILESAQMVSTAFHLRGHGTGLPWLYKPAYEKHPCTKWTAESNHNICWLIELALELENIRQELGCPYHASTEVIKFARDYLAEEFPFATMYHFTDHALAMPIEIRTLPRLSPYEKYQEYYRRKNKLWTALDKRPMTWKNRPVPSFMSV